MRFRALIPLFAMTALTSPGVMGKIWASPRPQPRTSICLASKLIVPRTPGRSNASKTSVASSQESPRPDRRPSCPA